jgi:hypothetical protein
VRIHHRIDTEVEFSDDQLRKLLGLHTRASITEVKREERDWLRRHYVLVVKAQRHVHKRRGV